MQTLDNVDLMRAILPWEDDEDLLDISSELPDIVEENELDEDYYSFPEPSDQIGEA